jgi:hypothetical protein
VGAFDLPVRLRPVGPRLLRRDAQLGAAVTPAVGAIGASVVRQNPLNDDTAGSEPGHGPLQHPHGGDRSFDLRVSNTGMVVDHGMHECFPKVRVMIFTLRGSDGRETVPDALSPPDKAMATTIRDIAELRHINMDHRPRVGVFVTADDFAGAFVDVVQLVDPHPHQHRMHCRGRHAELYGDTDRSQTLFPSQETNLAHHLLGRFGWAQVGPGGAIFDPRSAHRLISGGPPVRCRPRRVEVLRCRRHRPAVVDNQARDP